MTRLRVGVLRGGPSSEYDVSLKTGANVLKYLPEKYHPIDIVISKDGVWHVHGMPRSPERALKHLDVVFNAMHGEFGEDGKVQKILDNFAIPYTGSTSLASSIGMNKGLSKVFFEKHGLRSPYYMIIRSDDDIQKKASFLLKNFIFPIIVKPATGGSSIGVSIVRKLGELKQALETALGLSHTAVVEEFIEGREATCGVINHFRNEEIYSLLPVEIIHPEEHGFFDYNAKYTGVTNEICPGNFTDSEKSEIQRLAKAAHEVLGLRHYSRSDFIISPKRGVFILEANSLPGLTDESLMPKSLKAVGCEFPDFLDHLLTLTMEGK